MRKIFLLFLILLLTSFAFADCQTTPDKITRFDATYTFTDEKKADVLIVVNANYSEACLIEKLKDSINVDLNEFEIIEITSQDVSCPKEFLTNYVNRELGDFTNSLTCTATFTTDKNSIRMNFVGNIQVVGRETQISTREIKLGGSEFTSSLPSDSSLTINIPQRYVFSDTSLITGQKTNTKIVWAPFPKEEVNFDFYLEETLLAVNQDELLESLPIIIIGGIGVALLLFFIILISIRKPKTPNLNIEKTPEKTVNNLEEEGKKIRQKMLELEKSYLKGGLDENTYRRLMEQYQYQLNDIRVELKQKKNPIIK